MGITYYVIGGTGNASANVIETGLSDVHSLSTEFVYLWTGRPTDGQARVLDWLLEHEASFTVVTVDGKVHPKIEAAAKRILTVESLVTSTFDSYHTFTLLVLWDEEIETKEPTHFVYDLITQANALGMESLDLCNGLVPLLVDNNPLEATRKPQDAPKKDTLPPTQEPKIDLFKSIWVLTEIKGEQASAVYFTDKATLLEYLNK